ncbi:MAG: heme biosynthesis protein HemY [Candidatus Dactylopiibacterium carminicum]|uniref:Heme biosynthesis protein HemY n=1 Tax=Candidatus Dactylopiibacterium carminicum TaxID=857335 RepID=A0A272ERD1_9RHOO|nr:heme biosynthesis HemY N-terminal domain-containing protein [Candidatus Dactylopiibacterium carminicum]KAF7598741.1 heme biosynthesis protein HemY [Candidatus Dactylopiibacterium carminicum]PAS92634.1 MAG: heme biosynthesis protein HemY [Candidatus Dactylopiibacterium carminicum]PAS96142.1 MAG: heme biosynthesis protein HemY [Candidatus Dactylopiibacterium carminicum]PAS98760.1 MAG: hypothetical protein BSR46_11680 [Candidatus Dactylopiibacterium carminicum]
MRSILWLIGLFALAVVMIVAARYNEAYALIVWAPYRVQVSLNLVILVAAAVFLLTYYLLRLVRRAFELPQEVSAFRARRREKQAQRALADAQRFFIEGRYGQAYRQAEKAWSALTRPAMAALLAAQSAHALRQTEKRDAWLVKAAEDEGDTRMARLVLEAEMALSERDFETAAMRIETLRDGGHRHIAVLRLALQAEQGRGRWAEVARIARSLRKVGALTPEQAAPLLRRALIEQLRDAEGDLGALERVWQSLPEIERQDSGLLLRALPRLLDAGDRRLAAEAIESQLARDWEPELAALYGRCETDDLRRQLAIAEGWLKQHPDDADLLMSLGRLCLRAQLWGKAQSYFEASLFLLPTRAAHLELARLAERLERVDDAQRHYRLAASLGA